MEKINNDKLKLRHQTHERDENGRIILNMNVKDDSDFLSVFSVSNTPVISLDVAQFIETITYSVLPKEQLLLRIYSDCINDSEKEDYKNAIKEYYKEHYKLNKQELKRNAIISSILALIGIVILAIAFFIKNKTGSEFWMEVVNVIAWVFIWEAVHVSAFKNRGLKIATLRYHSYMEMDIEFYPCSCMEEKKEEI